MKTNLKLNSNTPLQALASKARKAAAIATVERIEKSCGVKKRAVREIPEIDRDIRSIFLALNSRAAENSVAVMEKPAQGSSCKGIIHIYDRSDLCRQRDEEASYRELRNNGSDHPHHAKPYRAKPTVTYAFYPKASDHTKLGSVAIYGENADSRRKLILKIGTLFGHRVISANIEMGRRPFVDVKLRS